MPNGLFLRTKIPHILFSTGVYMAICRRDFFRTAAAGAAASAAIATFPEFVFAGEPRRGMAGNFGPPAGHGIILDSNENAYGAPESARAAMREALGIANRYPRDGAYENLIARIAKMNKVTDDQILLGCGSGELLRSVVEAFAVPDKNVITPSPTFESLGNHAKNRGLNVTRVPLTKNFTHDLDAMAAAITPQTGLIYICNPNNPTASITPRKDIDAFLARIPGNVTVIIDEAYHHFVSSPDYVSYLEKPSTNPKVVVLRTFSKIFGMAGLRVGYAVAQKPQMEKIRSCSFFDNVNCVAANAASAAL